jgi:hypothetical protein
MSGVWSKQLGPQPFGASHDLEFLWISTVPPDPVDPLDADESLGSTETCDWRTSGLTLGCGFSERLV